jgi:hypothetical protein
MITVRQTPYISLIDVCRELGMRVRDFEFAYHANNDSFAILGLTDADVEDLWAEIECEKDKKRRKRLENDYSLINLLRTMGHRGNMIVFINW